MATAVRILDDGAWLSVDDSREVSVSEIWPLFDAGPGACDCSPAYFLLEAFYDVSVATDGEIAVGAVGQCIDCGAEATFDHFPVGRVVDGTFRPFPPGEPTFLYEPDA